MAVEALDCVLIGVSAVRTIMVSYFSKKKKKKKHIL